MGVHRSICSRTDSPPSRCVSKPLYWTMFYQHLTMHCFYQFLLMSSIFTRILSLAHLFYAYFTHGPNKSASAQYDNTRGAWLTQEGCTLTERKERIENSLRQHSTRMALQIVKTLTPTRQKSRGCVVNNEKRKRLTEKSEIAERCLEYCSKLCDCNLNGKRDVLYSMKTHLITYVEEVYIWQLFHHR